MFTQLSGGELLIMAIIESKTTSQKKQEFMHLLADNPTIFALLDNPNAEIGDDLINHNIFPRLKINFTATDASTYIGIKIDYPSITSNSAIKDCVITFMIISHKDHISTIWGDSRTDLIAEELIKMFNFNYKLGYTLKLVKDMEDPFDVNYYYRRVTFATEDTNSIGNKLNNGV